MRSFFILVVVAAAVAAGWYFIHHRGAPAPAPTAEQSPFSSAPVLDPTPVSSTDAGTAPANPPPGPSGPPPAAAKQALDQADALWASAGNDPANAPTAPQMDQLYSAALKQLYNQPGQDAREQQLVAERLTPLGTALFFSKTRFADDTTHFGVHAVAPGENPELIAKKYGMSREFLNRLRGRDANDSNIAAGDSVKVVKVKDGGGFFLHIDKSGYYLDCYVVGMFARRYPVSIGAPASPTPTGKTHLTDRCWHPDWTRPSDGKVIHYGEPDHLLGPIWLPFDEAIGKKGVGIHGYTGADQSSGQQVSNGCVRLQNDGAIELYNTLSSPGRAPIEVEITE
jgi:lipoprotein-anchoring transpeptidase ErfK/SrfK